MIGKHGGGIEKAPGMWGPRGRVVVFWAGGGGFCSTGGHGWVRLEAPVERGPCGRVVAA